MMKIVYKPYSLDVPREHKTIVDKIGNKRIVDEFFAHIEADNFEAASRLYRLDDELRNAASDKIKDMLLTRHSDQLTSSLPTE